MILKLSVFLHRRHDSNSIIETSIYNINVNNKILRFIKKYSLYSSFLILIDNVIVDSIGFVCFKHNKIDIYELSDNEGICLNIGVDVIR